MRNAIFFSLSSAKNGGTFNMTTSTERFGDRAMQYARFRPGYPLELISFLEQEGLLPEGAVVADIGSGTGKLSEVFLARGYGVYGVEPNGEMRAQAERVFQGRENFHSVAGTSEATGLEAASVDLVAVGQAFHWFDVEQARREFLRILRPDGAVAIVWNEREPARGFGPAYQEIVDRYKMEAVPVSHASVSAAALERFFAPSTPVWMRLEHACYYDLEAITGRMVSSSYMPNTSPRKETMIAALEKAFAAHAVHGRVELRYTAVMCCGRLHRRVDGLR